MRLFLLISLLCLPCARGLAHPLGDAPGELVDLGERKLHLLCAGTTAPVVLVDIGLAAASLEWEAVQQAVAPHQRLCIFERAGYGWSELGPLPRTAAQNVDDLLMVQQLAHLPPPYVLVGHSYGGFDVQLFARRHPAKVAALVLVDAAHPEQAERFEAPPYNTRIAPTSSWGIVQFGQQTTPSHPALTPAARALGQFQRENWRPRRTISGELLGFRQSEQELRAAPPLQRLPLVVITRGRRMWPPGERGDQLEALWRELQAELADQSPLAIHLLARDSGHQIHLDQPELVAYAIALATDAARAEAGTPRPALAGAARWQGRVGNHVEVLADGTGLARPTRLAASGNGKPR